jgi:peptidoglycan/LPS O-acetylase OafA/YrhL
MLDVLRGIAVLAVFVQHLGDRFRLFVLSEAAKIGPPMLVGWLRAVLERGHWGVDLFFVLSGFTLGMGFARDHQRGRVRPASEFFLRRAARILPAFYLALLVHLLARPALLHAPQIIPAIAVHAVLLHGYWGPGHLVLIGASWSLTTESHFYLLAPWLARWFLRRPVMTRPQGWAWFGRVVWPLAVVCLAVWALRGVLHDLALLPHGPAGMLELSQRKWFVCRMDQFALGLAAAVAVHARLATRDARSRRQGLVLMALGALVLGAAAPIDAATYWHFGGGLAYVLVSLGMTALVVGAALLPERGPAAWASEPLRALGVVSYGFFLYHQLGLELAARWLPGAGGAASWATLLSAATAGITLAIALGAASWFWVEAPALARAGDWAKRRTSPRLAQCRPTRVGMRAQFLPRQRPIGQ